MALNNSSLPLNRHSIETRPAKVEEWLDSLPYLDFDTSAQLLFDATQATNEQSLNPETRMELVELYGKPYQYYIDSQIKAGAQQTLQSIDTARQQIKLLKIIAHNLAFACRLSADQTLERKTLWGQIKPPLIDLLLSLNYLSHVLIFCYLEYSPNPKDVWKEINFIFHFTESLSLENSALNLPESRIRNGSTSISQAYKRILMASLADPHHLPYGAIWEIFEQLTSWSGLVKIGKFENPEDPSCRFVIDLDGDESPLPLVKFDVDKAEKSHRLMDASDLISEINKQSEIIETGGRTDTSVILSPFYSKTILNHLLNVWELPAMREAPRQKGYGSLKIVCGIKPAYYYINGQKEFYTQGAMETHPHNKDIKIEYQLDEWTLSDESIKGFAVINNDKPLYNIKVGNLIAINSQGNNWSIGVIRWMIINERQENKIGIEILSREIETAAIRALNGSEEDTRFRRALLLKNDNNKLISIISSKGIFIRDRRVEILKGGERVETRTETLLESTGGFEQFQVSN
jgi:hypothetical protein